MPRHAICVIIDGLRASALGCYGNTWNRTPSLDQLASQSLVLEWMWCESPALDAFYRSAWSVEAPLSPERAAPLPRLLAEAGIPCSLTTDDPSLADFAAAAGVTDLRTVELASTAAAMSLEETELARLFAVAAGELESWVRPSPGVHQPPGRLLWLHARGFHGRWDAPHSWREQLMDEDDPPPSPFLVPPPAVAVADDDQLLDYRVAYAAQVEVLDGCVGGLLEALAEFELLSDTLVILAGSRGFALGEHGAVGSEVNALYGELLHIPCLVRSPLTQPPPPRSSTLAQPGGIYATLCDWFGLATPPSGHRPSSFLAPELSLGTGAGPQYIIARGDNGERALRTAAWMLRQPPYQAAPTALDSPPPPPELYAKPDDRWEANEVADRCRDVADRLLAVIAATSREDAASAAGAELPLDEDLIDPATR